MERNYTLVHPANIEEWWPRVSPWLMQAIGDLESWADINVIKMGLCNGHLRLWTILDPDGSVRLALVTEPHILGGVPYLVLRWAGGKDVEEFSFDISILEFWAKNNGFAGVQIWGRKGWEKLFRPLGYRHEFTVISKLLNERMN